MSDAMLAFLGVSIAVIVAPGPDTALTIRSTLAGGRRAGIFAVLGSNLGHPKMAAFFPSLRPQFAPLGEGAFSALLALGLVFSSLTLAWLTAYAATVAAMGGVLRRPAVRRAMEGLAGAALLGLGARLAAERP